MTQSPISYEIFDKSTGNGCWGILVIKVVDCIQSLACNDQIVVNVPKGGFIEVVPEMILEGGPYCPSRYYDIILTDINGNNISTTLDENTPSPLNVTITDKRTGNSCWGELIINVIDCQASLPLLECKNVEISCQISTDPETIGIPVDGKKYIVVKETNHGGYSVKNDSCPSYRLVYTDFITKSDCIGDFYKQIERTWVISDFLGNSSSCVQYIEVAFDTIPDNLGLHNYDGIDLPLIDCKGSWPKLQNGAPSPSIYGYTKSFELWISSCRFK